MHKQSLNCYKHLGRAYSFSFFSFSFFFFSWKEATDERWTSYERRTNSRDAIYLITGNTVNAVVNTPLYRSSTFNVDQYVLPSQNLRGTLRISVLAPPHPVSEAEMSLARTWVQLAEQAFKYHFLDTKGISLLFEKSEEKKNFELSVLRLYEGNQRERRIFCSFKTRRLSHRRNDNTLDGSSNHNLNILTTYMV